MRAPNATHRECDEKTARLTRLLDARGLDAVLLVAGANIAWLTGGGRSIIDISQARGACARLVTRTGARLVIANTIETLTATPGWPTFTVTAGATTLTVPDILARSM